MAGIFENTIGCVHREMVSKAVLILRPAKLLAAFREDGLAASLSTDGRVASFFLEVLVIMI